MIFKEVESDICQASDHTHVNKVLIYIFFKFLLFWMFGEETEQGKHTPWKFGKRKFPLIQTLSTYYTPSTTLRPWNIAVFFCLIYLC